jgi:hypothetical protein
MWNDIIPKGIALNDAYRWHVGWDKEDFIKYKIEAIADNMTSVPGLPPNIQRELAVEEAKKNLKYNRWKHQAILSIALYWFKRNISQTEDKDGTVDEPRAETENIFRRENDIWQIEYNGEKCLMKNSKGHEHIYYLLNRPGQMISAMDLVQKGVGPAGEDSGLNKAQLNNAGLHEHHFKEADAATDKRSLAEYRENLREIEGEIEHAKEYSLSGILNAAEAQKAELLLHIKQTTNLFGRPKKCADPNERARSTATKVINKAIQLIEKDIPSLGKHLRGSINTGNSMAYKPQAETEWSL